ncbi:MAG TPA: DNA helicase RecQ [Clostridiales bacterium UBA8960]|nr:DNA helicase RecQ [Clostridiales bacterium UBA8960]
MKQILKQIFGHDAFRQGQEELIDQILSGRDVMGIMPTGAGKSVCYQVPALSFSGTTLVISPLISLMKDQVGALVQAGVKTAFINSTLTAYEYGEVYRNAQKGEYKLIYVAPERLMTDDFMSLMTQIDIDLIAIDEAHCVSQWGQDFRPSYVRISDFIATLPKRPVVAAFTATATAEVSEDIVRLLRLNDPYITVTGFDRANLTFNVIKPENKFKALLEIVLINENKSGIVYCATRKAVEDVCSKLCEYGFEATRYHAGLSEMERHDNQDDFIFDRKKVIVATNAFGMGIDKSNVSFVVHYNMPKSIEAYYQEAGRAGRDGEPAQCTLLYSGQDERINRFMIDQSDMNPEISPRVRAQIKEKDLERLKMMTFYSTTTECLREFILRYFGEKTSIYCGNCSSCNTTFETVDITVEAQKIISCVYRMAKMNRSYGKLMIVDVLRGSGNEKIKRLGLDKLSTFNIMPDVPSRRLHKIVDFLVDNDYLRTSSDEFPVIELSSRANEVIKHLEPVMMKLPIELPKATVDEDKGKKGKRGKKSKIQLPEGADEGLFEKLKALRTKLAADQRVPAYIIFSDASLKDMCAKQPKTLDAFLDVSGVGAAKLEKYGNAFISVINESE